MVVIENNNIVSQTSGHPSGVSLHDSNTFQQQNIICCAYECCGKQIFDSDNEYQIHLHNVHCVNNTNDLNVSEPKRIKSEKMIDLIKCYHDALYYSNKGLKVEIEKITLQSEFGKHGVIGYYKLIKQMIHDLTLRRKNELKRVMRETFGSYKTYMKTINNELKTFIKNKRQQKVNQINKIDPLEIIEENKDENEIDQTLNQMEMQLKEDLKHEEPLSEHFRLDGLDEEVVEIKSNEEIEEPHVCYFQLTEVYNIIKCNICNEERQIGLLGGGKQNKKGKISQKDKFDALDDIKMFNKYIRGSKSKQVNLLPSILDQNIYKRIVNAGIRTLARLTNTKYNEGKYEKSSTVLQRIKENKNSTLEINKRLLDDLIEFIDRKTIQVSGTVKLRKGGKQSRVFTYKINKAAENKLRKFETEDLKQRFMEEVIAKIVKDYYDDEAEDVIIDDYDGIVEINYLPNIADMKMTGVKDLITLFDHLNSKGYELSRGTCVIDYIYNVYLEAEKSNKGKTFKKITRAQIEEEFQGLGVKIKEGITTNEIMLWAKNKENISVYAVDANLETYAKHIATIKPRIILSYVSAHGHLFPISDPALQSMLRYHNKINFTSLKQTGFTIISEHIKLILKNSDEYRRFIKGEHFDEDCLLIEDDLEEVLELIIGDNTRIKQEFDNEEYVCREYINDMNVVDQIKLDENGHIIGLVHPISGVAIKKTSDYEARKKVCDYFKQEYNCEDFTWQDQSWTQIGQMLFNLEIGTIKPSHDTYNDKFMEQFQPLAIKQILINETEEPKDAIALDHKRCYVTALLNNEDHFPIYSNFDDIKLFTADCEMIDNAEYMIGLFKFEELKFHRAWWTARDTAWLLNNKIIRRDQISHYRVFRRMIDCRLFKGLIEKIKTVGSKLNMEKLDKIIINPLIGMFNKRVEKNVRGYGTLDKVEAFALYASAQDREVDVTYKQFEMNGCTYYLLKFTNQREVSENYTSIWRSVVSHSNIALIKKIKELRELNETMVLYSVKVDAIYAVGVNKVPNDERWCLEKWNPPKFEHKGAGREVFMQPVYKWNEIQKDDLLDELQSCLIEGPAGAGKTTMIVDLIKRNKDLRIVITTFTHAARENIRKTIKKHGGITIKDEVEENESIVDPIVDLRTVDSLISTYVFNKLNRGCKEIDFDIIIIDEVSMLSKFHIQQIYKLTQSNDITVVCLGDFNQCLPVETDGVIYKYKECDIFKAMLGNYLYMPFNPNLGRYDQETYDLLEEILTTRKLPECLKYSTTNPNLSKSIVYSNSLRTKINQDQGGYDYKIGQEVIAEYNTFQQKDLKNAGIFNSQFYIIRNIENQTVELMDLEQTKTYPPISISYIQPTNAITTHKYQGRTIYEDYNIYQIDSMSINMLYTALSRCENWNQWHLRYTDKIFEDEPLRNTLETSAKLVPQCIIEFQGEYYVFDATQNVEEYCSMTGLKVENIVNVGTFKCTTQFGLTKIMAKLQNKNQNTNIRNVAPNDLNREVLKQKVPIKDTIIRKNNETYHELSIRKILNGETITIRKRYNESNKEKITKEMEIAQEEIIQRYFTGLTRAKIDLFPHEIQYKNNKTVETGSVDIEMIDYVLDPGTIANTKVYINETEERPFYVNYYWKQQYALDQAKAEKKVVIKLLVPDEKKGGKHLYGAVSKERLIQMIGQEPYLYEIFTGAVRLYCDLDLDLDVEECCDDAEHLLSLTIDLMIETAKEFGVSLEESNFRVLSACNSKKISFHITYLNEIFRNCTTQKAYWNKAKEIAERTGDYEDLWFKIKDKTTGEIEKRFAIDLSVYTKNRCMRTIYSTKPNKNNHLKPVAIKDGELKELENVNVEEYLIGSRCILESRLAREEEIVNKHVKSKHMVSDQAENLVSLSLIQQIKANPLFNDYYHTGLKQNGNYITLVRKQPGLCPCCKRTHDKRDAFVIIQNNKITKMACYSNTRIKINV